MVKPRCKWLYCKCCKCATSSHLKTIITNGSNVSGPLLETAVWLLQCSVKQSKSEFLFVQYLCVHVDFYSFWFFEKSIQTQHIIYLLMQTNLLFSQENMVAESYRLIAFLFLLNLNHPAFESQTKNQMAIILLQIKSTEQF